MEYRVGIQNTWTTASVSRDSVADLYWAEVRAADPPTVHWVAGPKCLQSKAREERWRGRKAWEVI